MKVKNYVAKLAEHVFVLIHSFHIVCSMIKTSLKHNKSTKEIFYLSKSCKKNKGIHCKYAYWNIQAEVAISYGHFTFAIFKLRQLQFRGKYPKR